MKTYIDKNYGADADGNRGITITEYELENSDNDEIVEQLKAQLVDCEVEDYPLELVIEIDGVEFTVEVKDYL